MPSHRYNTRRLTKPVNYYDGDSPSVYKPEDEFPVAESCRRFVTTSRDPVIQSAKPSFYSSASAAYTDTQIQTPPTTRYHTTFHTLQTHTVTTCARCHRSIPSQPASPQSCPKNCGWGHYNSFCGLKIPLVPQPIFPPLPTRRSNPNPSLNPNTHSSPYNLNHAQVGDDSGYASAIDEGDKPEGAEEGEEEETSLVFAWDRFKAAGKKGGRTLGRDYKVDGEGIALWAVFKDRLAGG